MVWPAIASQKGMCLKSYFNNRRDGEHLMQDKGVRQGMAQSMGYC